MKRLFPLIVLLTLAACSSTPQYELPAKDPAAAWARHSARMEQIHDWDIEGRIAIRSYNDAVNANLRWQQHGDHYEINLSGPFGSGAVHLRGAPGVVTLQTDGKEMVAQDAESLLYRATGLLVPVESLKYWIRGLPEPDGRGTRMLDPQGRLAQVSQDRWKVRFRAYEPVASQQMPVKVFVDNHQLSVRIVIDKWTLPQS